MQLIASIDQFFFKNLHPEAKQLHRHLRATPSVAFILIGVLSLFWLLLRSATKPTRLSYPCQKIALTNSLTFLTWIAGLLGTTLISRKLKLNNQSLLRSIFLVSLLVISLQSAHYYYRQHLDSMLVQTAIGQSNAKVTWIQDTSAAGTWSSTYSARVNQTAVNHMMDLALTQYTNQPTVAAAWDYLFKNHNHGPGYQSGQNIAIKINFNNVWSSDQHIPNYQVVNALLDQLANQVGINQANLIVYDISRPFETWNTQTQFVQGIKSKFPNVKLNPDKSVCGDTIWQGQVRLACTLQNSHYLINMPLLRVHGGASATLSLKNHFGSVDNPNAMHMGRFEKWNGLYSIEHLNNHPWIRDKHLVTIADAIYGLKSGNEEGVPSSSHGMNPPPNSIFISEDPIAADSVMIDFIATYNNNSFPNGEPRKYYVSAASIGLGTYETAYPNFNYKLISLNRCINNVCTNSGSPPPTSPPTGPPSTCPADINQDGVVDLSDFLIFRANFLKSTITNPRANINQDGVVNLADFLIFRTNFLKPCP